MFGILSDMVNGGVNVGRTLAAPVAVVAEAASKVSDEVAEVAEDLCDDVRRLFK